MKRFCATAVLALFCGCGGGGGGGGGGNPGPGPGPGIPEQIAQEVLENCGVDTLADLELVYDALNQLLNPGVPITSWQLNAEADGISFSVDLDGDVAPDAQGFIRFQDDQGVPFTPDLTPLQGGPDGINQIFQNLPDGTQVVAQFMDPISGSMGDVIVVFNSGAATDISGQITLILPPNCQSVFQFTGLTLASISGPRPTGATDSTFVAPEGTLEGTTTFNGTDVALVEVTVDGGTDTFSFNVDFILGTVTLVP